MPARHASLCTAGGRSAPASCPRPPLRAAWGPGTAAARCSVQGAQSIVSTLHKFAARKGSRRHATPAPFSVLCPFPDSLCHTQRKAQAGSTAPRLSKSTLDPLALVAFVLCVVCPPEHEHRLGAHHLLPKVGHVSAVHAGAARSKRLGRRLRQPAGMGEARMGGDVKGCGDKQGLASGNSRW